MRIFEGNQVNSVVITRCSVCGKPIEPHDGCVYIVMDEVLAKEAASQADVEEDVSRKDPEALFPVLWRAAHNDCMILDDSAYWLDVERCGSVADVLDFTAHLLEKTWLPSTNWSQVIRDLAQSAGGSMQ